jgi:hypothetical protein
MNSRKGRGVGLLQMDYIVRNGSLRFAFTVAQAELRLAVDHIAAFLATSTSPLRRPCMATAETERAFGPGCGRRLRRWRQFSKPAG